MTRQGSAQPPTAWLPSLAATALMCAASLVLADDNADDNPGNGAADDSAHVTDSATELADFTLNQSVSLVAGFYYPSEFCPEPKFGADLEVPDVALLYTPGFSSFVLADGNLPLVALASLEQTDTFIDRLAELETLEILPLLRTESTSVYFGINRDGRVGMHINSRD